MGTGLILSVIGTAMSLGSCCLWSFSGRLIDPAPVPGGPGLGVSGLLQQSALLAAGCLVGSFVGGIALVAAGVGLYGEKASAGPLASLVTLAVASYFWTLALLYLLAGEGWILLAVPATIAVVMTGLAPFALMSWRVMRKYPPSPDQNAFHDDGVR